MKIVLRTNDWFESAGLYYKSAKTGYRYNSLWKAAQESRLKTYKKGKRRLATKEAIMEFLCIET